MQFLDCKAGNRLVELEISCSRIERSRAVLEANGLWSGQKEEVPIVSTEEIVSGTIESSLWGSINQAGRERGLSYSTG